MDRFTLGFDRAQRLGQTLYALAVDLQPHEKIIIEPTGHDDRIHVAIKDATVLRKEMWV